jgi:hypothetical protein
MSRGRQRMEGCRFAEHFFAGTERNCHERTICATCVRWFRPVQPGRRATAFWAIRVAAPFAPGRPDGSTVEPRTVRQRVCRRRAGHQRPAARQYVLRTGGGGDLRYGRRNVLPRARSSTLRTVRLLTTRPNLIRPLPNHRRLLNLTLRSSSCEERNRCRISADRGLDSRPRPSLRLTQDNLVLFGATARRSTMSLCTEYHTAQIPLAKLLPLKSALFVEIGRRVH